MLRIVSQVDGVVDPRIELPVTHPTDRDRDGPRQGAPLRGQAGRRAARRGHPVAGHPGRQHLREAEGVRRDRAGRARHARRACRACATCCIDGPGGGHLRLGQVADVRVTPTPIVIERDAVSRRLDVVAGVDGRGLGSVANEIEDRLADMSFPLEYHAEVLQETTGEEIDSHPDDRLRDRRRDRGLPAAAGSLRELAPGRAGVPDACRSRWWAECWQRSSPAPSCRSARSSASWRCSRLAARTGVLLIRRFQDLEREGDSFGPGSSRAARASGSRRS